MFRQPRIVTDGENEHMVDSNTVKERERKDIEPFDSYILKIHRVSIRESSNFGYGVLDFIHKLKRR